MKKYLFLFLLIFITPAFASSQQQILIDQSGLAAADILEDPEYKVARDLLQHARAVMIFPEMLKGGFILGGFGGDGVLLIKQPGNVWSYPLFYTIGGGSIGIQAGLEKSAMVMVIMDDHALQALLSNEFKMGIDADIAVGPIGTGVGSNTSTNLKGGIFTYSRAAGLFGGGSLQGAVVTGKDSWNTAYYGTSISTPSLILTQNIGNEGADRLRDLFQRLSE